MKKHTSKVIFISVCIIALIALPGTAFGKVLTVSPATITPPSTPLQEGADYATLALQDSWDMSQFTDISQMLNGIGSNDLLRKISVTNGVFQATSSPKNLAEFWPLPDGLDKMIKVGKVGALHPISPSTYSCFYLAMNTNSLAINDMYQVLWFQNSKYGNGVFGTTLGIPLYPEANYKRPTPGWRLYSLHLPDAPTRNTKWNNMPRVEAIRIRPTMNAGVTFSVDWVRLTDCNPVNATLTWSNGTAADTSLWLQPVGTTRNIRVATDLDGTSGSYTLDVQGIEPGSYYVALGNAATCCSQINTSTPLVINQSPIVTFSRPSFSSGPGASWDFNSMADVATLMNFKSGVIKNGNLVTVTNSGPRPGGKDAQIILTTPPLNTPPIDTHKLRYLTFRMSSTNGMAPWQNPGSGMMARLIWELKGPRGGVCYMVGSPIPYDIGYNTYSIDLYDSYNGQAITAFGDCAGLPKAWKDAGAVLKLRFDPNENVTCVSKSVFVRKTCGNYIQKLDYFRLTANDQAIQGTPYPIQITLNRTPESLTSLNFYYTTSRSDPTQAAAAGSQTNSANNVTYQWDTTGVTPGTYYICANADDGLNPVNYCSEAPVDVITP